MTGLFKSSSKSGVNYPLYHITSGILVQTSCYVSQVYAHIFNRLKDKIPVYLEDLEDEIKNSDLKINLNNQEEIYYSNINYYLRQGLEELNYNVDIHDKGFDILNDVSPRTLILLTGEAIRKSLKDTELTLATQREIERQRERKEKMQEVEIDIDEIGEELEL
ncbi:hypothetical protein [Peptoniphilus harei]|uniref:Uncharacterized protein n=1 Tax=Peptoniphilus harei TaxID=54005 RepID=A0A943SRC1_9FIRM|nr:hypothetical protein [Peptoniphilus harei]MBS6535407.1 hypothetical protein [Peptoniphilus harei]